MIRFRIITGLCLIFINAQVLFSQPKLLFALEPNNVEQATFVKRNGIQDVIVVYQQYIITSNELDETKLRRNINRLIPDKNFTGYVVLNWEGPGYSALINNQVDNPQRFQKYLAQFIRSVDIVKEMRPNVKISYFDIPQRKADRRTVEQWYRFANGLKPLLEKLDFFSPNLYSSYLENEEKKDNLENINKHLSFALEFGKKFNKPVYPFMWHRIQPSGTKHRYANIPTNQFSKEVKYALNLKNDDEKIAGIIWWQSEQYDTYRHARQNQIGYKNADVRVIRDTKETQSNFFQRYYDSIKAYIK